ncbi:MAG: methionyl-tRNA formyltransferase [Gammaproteobacteria bacterium]|nr:methionyl-tRNA formyltransferase [Gammaproteobacteria bacterium]
MKVVFAGTPQFAAIALDALIKSKHRVMAVYTQPDRPSGRGLKLKAPPVKELALQFQIPVFQPASLKNGAEVDELKQLQADAMVVAAYGLLLPAEVLHLFPQGCLNIHPSLLPKWRGAAPIPRTLAAGESITGVTIMQMDPGLDTGPMFLQEQYILEPNETAQTLHDQLATIGARLMVQTLDQLERNEIKALAQDNALATYAHKISKEEALIDWQRKAQELEYEVRAFNPWPVCYTTWGGETLRVWEAKAIDHYPVSPPRTILHASAQGLDIATGQGALRLLKVQLPGAKAIPIADFYHAKQKDLIVGERFI